MLSSAESGGSWLQLKLSPRGFESPGAMEPLPFCRLKAPLLSEALYVRLKSLKFFTDRLPRDCGHDVTPTVCVAVTVSGVTLMRVVWVGPQVCPSHLKTVCGCWRFEAMSWTALLRM